MDIAAAPTERSEVVSGSVGVSGGSGGIVAQCEVIRALASQFGVAASQSLTASVALHKYLVHPVLLASSIVDPFGFAAFEAELITALDGPCGLTWIVARTALLEAELRVAADGYEDADHLVGRLHDEVLGALTLPRALAAGIGAAIGGASAGTAAQRVLTDDPEFADTVADALGVPIIAAGASRVLPDGRGIPHELGVDDTLVATNPPRSIADIVGELARRDDDPRHGVVDVRILTMADGSRRAIVDITGTKSWSPLPTADVTSLTTNGRALVGQRGAYEQGILAALHRAGVRRDEPVLLVGHSEGGMVAVTTARDALHKGDYRVTHVITAGSPVGRTVAEIPRSVQVLALENERDVVPHADGVANPDQPNVTTARASFGDGTVLVDHSLDHAYVPLAQGVDASQDESLRSFRHSLRPYLRAVSVQTRTFQITRG